MELMKTFRIYSLLIATLVFAHPALASKNILVFGDSLSAGYGIARAASWPSLMQQKVRQNHPQYEVINASISGETTAGGVRRIDKALAEHQPVIVILALGANDGLRGTSISEAEKNLSLMIQKSRKAGARVLLLGMQLPPNYGMAYTDKFKSMYPKLAKTHQVALLPFMLADIAPEQFQADNLHPNATAQPIILQNVLGKLINSKYIQ